MYSISVRTNYFPQHKPPIFEEDQLARLVLRDLIINGEDLFSAGTAELPIFSVDLTIIKIGVISKDPQNLPPYFWLGSLSINVESEIITGFSGVQPMVLGLDFSGFRTPKGMRDNLSQVEFLSLTLAILRKAFLLQFIAAVKKGEKNGID